MTLDEHRRTVAAERRSVACHRGAVTTDELPPFEREVLSVVLEKLAPHGPESAEFRCKWSVAMWFIEVAPCRTSAAPVSIGVDGDELLLHLGLPRGEVTGWVRRRVPCGGS
jgi:hypothetical protein